MNEEKASDTYWEKVSDMIEEAESKYKKTGIVYDASDPVGIISTNAVSKISQAKLLAPNLSETFLHVISPRNAAQLKAH